MTASAPENNPHGGIRLLSGKYERKLDYKGRLAIPEDLLKTSDQDWSRVVVMRQEAHVDTSGDVSHGLLCLYDVRTWQEFLTEAYRTLDIDEARMFMEKRVADASTVDVDAMKRLTLPAPLLQFSRIEKQVIVTGILDHIEVWNPESYQSYVDALDDEVAVPSIEDLARRRIRVV